MNNRSNRSQSYGAGRSSRVTRASGADQIMSRNKPLNARSSAYARSTASARSTAYAYNTSSARSTASARSNANARSTAYAHNTSSARYTQTSRNHYSARNTSASNKTSGSGRMLGPGQTSGPQRTGLLALSNETRILLIFLIVVAVIISRLVILTIVDASELAAQAQSQRTTTIETPARRGTIYDRNLNILAMSVDATTIYVNPSEVIDPRKTATVLSEVLGGSVESYLSIITKSDSPTFAYVLLRGEVEMARLLQERNEEYRQEFIKSLPEGDGVPAVIPTALTGIHYLADSKRVYPYGRIGAQVIGAVGFDGYGISGIELAYDSILRGVNGVLVVERGKDTTPMVGGVQEKIVAINGQDIVLTIDIELQRYVENELERIAKAEDSENANALVLDGATGEIFAAASIPLYDRGNLTQAQVDAGATTLKCITTSFEPGSIFKTATAAAALETATVRPDDIIFCPSELTIYDYTIRDARPRSDQSMSFKTILVQSSNIGMSLIEERMGSSKHATYLAKYGFGQFTRIDYPGEACGILADVEKWTPIQAANISFGQGLQASSLQIASFYAAIANDGIYNQAHFLLACPQYNLYPTYDAREIVSSDTVADLEDMLCAVVSEGTGRSAAISGFQVAGKTGTAEKASPEGGYVKDEYIISFVGYIANSNSNLVCITSFDNPINSSSNLPSTFLFKTIMEFSINRYMIVPVEKTEATPGINASVGVVADGTGAMR